MSLSPQNFSDRESNSHTDDNIDNNYEAINVGDPAASVSNPSASNPPASDPSASNEVSGSDERFGDLIGHTIGHYLVEARLGGGAMASVYRAMDQIQKRIVALKVLLPGADNVVRERFRLEARTVSTLVHPNIVATLQVGQTGAQGVTYIAMELVEGSSLADLLEQKRQLSVVDCCKLLEPITRALAYAHANAVIHRDVKPSNILLRRVDSNPSDKVQISSLDFPVVPLLSDFGIARSLDAPELTSAGRTIGTPAYMAPEQCSGSRQIDGRADIYALGAVVYRCLVGRPPFVGTTTQILHAHVYDSVTVPQEMLAKLPPLVIDILKKTLAKEPEQRYQNAGLLAGDLAVAARLPAQPIIAQDERTATMAALPIVRPIPTTSQVVVPAPLLKSNVGAMQAGEVAALKQGLERDKLAGTSLPRPSHKRRESTNWAGVLLGSLLALLPLAVGLVVIASLLPSNWFTRWGIGGERPVATPSRAGIIETASPPTATLAPTTMANPQGTPLAISTNAASASAATINRSTPGVLVTAGVTATKGVTAAVSGTPVLTPTISVQDWWDTAQSDYEQRDWQGTRDSLIFILRTNTGFAQALATHQSSEGQLIAELFFGSTPSPFWSQWRTVFKDKESVRDMLFNAYVGMASAANASKSPKVAVDLFDNALALRPNMSTITRLRDATDKYVIATGEAQKNAALSLGEAHRAYAEELGEKGEACGAVEQANVADIVALSSQPSDILSKYSAACKGLQQAIDRNNLLKKFTGAIIYSTVEDAHSRIYRMPLTDTFALDLLVMDGSQPRLSPDGKMLIFHTTLPDAEGISSFMLNSGLKPTERSARYAPFVEDGRESPADWSPARDYIAFASRRESDRHSRIYVQPIADANIFHWFYGEDPAWQPSAGGGQWIVSRSTDISGNQLGLWQANQNGEQSSPLTNVSGDRRPAWSPDGKYIVFMSDARDGNWEIYRLTFADHTVIRLTNNSARDGLPTVSPDGKFVAFVSDRGGSLQIWAMGINGGDPTPIAHIQGNWPSWLEHAIQWVK
jgi:serine/threonine protein kinase/Tol biopolymer transport system component